MTAGSGPKINLNAHTIPPGSRIKQQTFFGPRAPVQRERAKSQTRSAGAEKKEKCDETNESGSDAGGFVDNSISHTVLHAEPHPEIHSWLPSRDETHFPTPPRILPRRARWNERATTQRLINLRPRQQPTTPPAASTTDTHWVYVAPIETFQRKTTD